MTAKRRVSKGARRARRRRERRGVALIMVLGAITVLTVFLAELQQETSAELSAALAERDALRAEYVAKSGMNLARLFIGSEPTLRPVIFDTLKTSGGLFAMVMLGSGKPIQIPIWNQAAGFLGIFNGEGGIEGFTAVPDLDPASGKNLGMPGGGRFDLKVADEQGKINANIASLASAFSEVQITKEYSILLAPKDEAGTRFFEKPDPDGQRSDARAICGALIDWADSANPDSLADCDPTRQGPSSSGGEDNFYQTIGLPYQRKNAAFDSLEELRLVRGVSDAFWTKFLEPDENDPASRKITVWGGQNINVNSADAYVLLSIICAFADLTATPMCMFQDPTSEPYRRAFISIINLAQTMIVSGGIPLFASKKQFVDALPATSQLRTMISGFAGEAANFGPIVVKGKDLENVVSVTTSTLSIYSTGIVKGRHRETEVRVHAVIDMRAPPGLNPPPPSGFMNPSGYLVYYRID